MSIMRRLCVSLLFISTGLPSIEEVAERFNEGVPLAVEVADITTVVDDAEEEAEDGASEDAGTIVKSAVSEASKIFVPLPSFANTAPSVNEIGASPVAIARKTIPMTIPSVPTNPGLSAIPAKCTLPPDKLFEKDGSCTHNVMIESVFETESACSLSAGNETSPDAAFIAWSGEETVTFTTKVCPNATVLVGGVNPNEAATAYPGNINLITANRPIPRTDVSVRRNISLSYQKCQNR
jgi:hypothetical protein